jgi:hypothetical protein
MLAWFCPLSCLLAWQRKSAGAKAQIFFGRSNGPTKVVP